MRKRGYCVKLFFYDFLEVWKGYVFLELWYWLFFRIREVFRGVWKKVVFG